MIINTDQQKRENNQNIIKSADLSESNNLDNSSGFSSSTNKVDGYEKKLSDVGYTKKGMNPVSIKQ